MSKYVIDSDDNVTILEPDSRIKMTRAIVLRKAGDDLAHFDRSLHALAANRG